MTNRTITAKEYDLLLADAHKEGEKISPNVHLLEFAIKLLRPKKNEKILDVGCGTGNLLLRLEELGVKSIGVDYSKKLLNVARARKLNVREGSATGLPLKPCSVDKVSMIGVIGYLSDEDIDICLREIKRVLKPRGRLVIRTGQPLNTLFNWFLLAYKQLKGETYVSRARNINPWGLLERMKKCGFIGRIVFDPLEKKVGLKWIVKLLFYPFITGYWIDATVER